MIVKKMFNETSLAWTKCSIHNELFLKTQLNYFNDLLKARGYVLLRDVCEACGLPIVSGDIIDGWKYPEREFVAMDLVIIPDDTIEIAFDCEEDIFNIRS